MKTLQPRKPYNIPLCVPDYYPTEFSESWFPSTFPGQMEQKDYDVLIVGTGAGGGAVLWRLCEKWGRNGKGIGVVEAGEQLLPTHIFNIPTYNLDFVYNIWRNPKYFKQIRDSYSNNVFLKVPVDYRIVNVLGGRTLHWGTAIPRMDRSDILQWPLSFHEMKHYYNIAEQVMNLTRLFSDGSAIQEIMLRRLQENGFPEASAVPRAVDLRQTQYGQIHSNVFFSFFNFLALSMNRRPFDLAIQSRVVRVLVERGRVIGIQVMSPDKTSYVLKAKTVVLSASTFETPRILLNSGIPGEAIGRYLANHSRLDAKGIAMRTDFPEVLGILDILLPRTEERPFQMQIDWLPFYQYMEKPIFEDIRVNFLPTGIVESRSENRITLDPIRKDRYGVPEPRIHFSYSEKDFEVIGQMVESVKHAASAMKVSLLKEDGLSEICLRSPGGENHDMGTCRMGNDPATSATNPYCQIHGISGLYVADNSIIPTTGAANPTLTTVALAIRTADYIIQQTS